MPKHGYEHGRTSSLAAEGHRAALADALVRAGAGDRDAFAFVYHQTSAKLFGLCLRMSPVRSEAEEALQDAYLTIWQRARLFDPDRGSAMTWLITVTRNRVLDRLRTAGRWVAGPIDLAMELPDPADGAAAVLEEDQEHRRMLACLAALDGGDAALIRAGFLEGSSYPTLATRAGLPLGTVKSRIRRALIKLRACLQ